LYSSLDEELQWYSGGRAKGALEKRDAWAKAGITVEKLKEHDSENHVFLFADQSERGEMWFCCLGHRPLFLNPACRCLSCAGEARAFLFERAFTCMIANDAELRGMLLNGIAGGGGGYSKGARPSLRGDCKGAGGFVSVLVGRVAVHSHTRV
jgi:hypothetical protein